MDVHGDHQARRAAGGIRPQKIQSAIWKAAQAVDGTDEALSERLTDEVIRLAELRYAGGTPDVEGVQDIVEKVLIEAGHARTAKAYILYREKRRGTRDINALIGATIDMFGDYLNDKDWQIKENSNMQKSVNGLNNYVREAFTKKYWLYEVYPLDVCRAHESGACTSMTSAFSARTARAGTCASCCWRALAAWRARWNPGPPSTCARSSGSW